MTRLAIFVVSVLAMTAAPSQAARRLTMKQAETETRRQAVIEASSWPGFPQYVSYGGGRNCSRRSRLRIVCSFWVADRLDDGGSSDPRTCDYRADVRVAATGSSKVRSSVEALGCERR